MADIGVQNVHHADTAAATTLRGALQAKAKAANIAAVHRATVAAAAQRTAEAAESFQGGRAAAARATATEDHPQRATRERRGGSHSHAGAPASSSGASASSSQRATPWDLSGDFTQEDLAWVAERTKDMAPRFDDYDFWSIHEAISDEAQSRGNDLRDQGVYEEEDVDDYSPGEEKVVRQGQRRRPRQGEGRVFRTPSRPGGGAPSVKLGWNAMD